MWQPQITIMNSPAPHSQWIDTTINFTFIAKPKLFLCCRNYFFFPEKHHVLVLLLDSDRALLFWTTHYRIFHDTASPLVRRYNIPRSNSRVSEQERLKLKLPALRVTAIPFLQLPASPFLHSVKTQVCCQCLDTRAGWCSPTSVICEENLIRDAIVSGILSWNDPQVVEFKIPRKVGRVPGMIKKWEPWSSAPTHALGSSQLPSLCSSMSANEIPVTPARLLPHLNLRPWTGELLTVPLLITLPRGTRYRALHKPPGAQSFQHLPQSARVTDCCFSSDFTLLFALHFNWIFFPSREL